MNTFKLFSIFVTVLILTTNTAFAAQDHNSSRSNKSSGISAPEDTDTLLREASTDASTVAKSMISADQRNGYNGDYIVTVDVRVTIERYIPGTGDRPPVIKEIKKRM